MTEIILVNPKLGFWGKYRNKEKLPAAILSVGTSLYNEGFSVKIIDQRIEKNWKEILLKNLGDKTLFVGISSLTGTQILHGLEVSKFIRQKSKTKIVWGGIHPTLLPEQTLENKYIDIIVRGEGEIIARNLAFALKNKKDLSEVEGISYKKQGKIIHNPDREFMDLEKLPEINYNLVDIENYLIEHLGHKMINYITSRGCPYGCKFCYSNKFHHRKWRAKSIKKTTNEMKNLIKNFKVNAFLLDDDEFFVDLERSKKLMKEFKKLNIRWASRGARIDNILKMDDDFLRLVQESGCNDLAIGGESGSDRILKLIGKGITAKDIIKANLKLSKYDIIPKFNFMVGFPTETIEDVKKTVRIINQIRRDNPKAAVSSLSIFTPYPGCELYDMAIKMGWKPPASLKEWSKFHYEVNNNPWMSEKMKKIISMLNFTSNFLNDNFETKPTFKINLMSKFYRPFARFRFSKLIYQFPFEIQLANILGFYDSKN